MRLIGLAVLAVASPLVENWSMTSLAHPLSLVVAVVASLSLLSGCATRTINAPLLRYDETSANQFEGLGMKRGAHEDLVILAFSGGGMRAAAFAYGVLETLRRIEMVTKEGRTVRLLDEVDLITGVSGGSFTALAYGLYGEKLFDEYEKRFLKRNVQGELVARILNPLNWSALLSTGWGRSELAANLYDEILFNGTTFADLKRTTGPRIAVSATELTTGSRVAFMPQNFDVMCADLNSFRLARAAAASSAVPVVLSPITINNYGGTCGYREPAWLRQFTETAKPPRPAGRILKRLQELRELDDAVEDRFFHLVDGGLSDNLGLRGVLDYLETFEALRAAGQPTPLDYVRRIIIFVVNSVSSPSTDWNTSESSPHTLTLLTKAAGVPIDRYSSESIELLKDIDARWAALREIRDSPAFAKGKDAKMANVVNAPNADIHTIDVSFQALKDKSEREFLNQLPTSFVLPDEAVDRLRAAAATIILASPDLREVLREAGASVVDAPMPAARPAK
jgi:NTE family protein